MKKLIMIMLAAIFMLTACSLGDYGSSSADTLEFYYVAGQNARSPDSIVKPEQRQLSSEPSIEDIISAYLLGPVTEGYNSPFPEGTQLIKYKLSGGAATITLSEQYSSLQGANRTIADYCLTMTLTALGEVDYVSIAVEGAAVDGALISPSDFIMSDDYESYSEQSITVYFADMDNRYLMSETRRMVAGENESVERYVIDQLIGGPVSYDKRSVMPAGSELIFVEVQDGLCTVGFSELFMINRPSTEAEERMTVYAIVNSLTELDGIDRVLIKSGSDELGLYRYMFLNEPLLRAEGVIGSAKNNSNEIDASFYMENWSPDFLSPIPCRVTKVTGRTEEYSVTKALIEYRPMQGYQNPIPKGTELLSTRTDDGLCVVDLSAEFIDNSPRSASAQRLAIMSIVMTLTELEYIDRVQITVEGVARDHLDYPMSEPIVRSGDLVFP